MNHLVTSPTPHIGLDYVSHDDVLPYTSSDGDPFHHELFPQFFVPTGDKEGKCYYPSILSGPPSFLFLHHILSLYAPGPSYIARDVLGLWRERNRDWLELNEVHRETTNGIRVTVMPFFMGNRDNGGGRVFWWRYNIRIESLTGVRVQLRERQWRIYSVAGTLETVKGRGVVGQVRRLL